MVNIAFITKLHIRGTSKAVFQYAYYNEKILNNTSLMMIKRSDTNTYHSEIYSKVIHQKFKDTFQHIIEYESEDEIESILLSNNCKILYHTVHGNPSFDMVYKHLDQVKIISHVIFYPKIPYGDIYGMITETFNKQYDLDTNLPVVPHIIDFRKCSNINLRQRLGIPQSAIVFGRYGGVVEFNIEFVHVAIRTIISERDDIYFLFANTLEFESHPRIITLPPLLTDEEKSSFINTCDAMIHARKAGESFGYSIAEFSVCNKPVITYNGTNVFCPPGYAHYDSHHIQTLGDKGVYYSNQDELENIFRKFTKPNETDDYVCYTQYTPEYVMGLFDKHFIQPALRLIGD